MQEIKPKFYHQDNIPLKDRSTLWIGLTLCFQDPSTGLPSLKILTEKIQ